MGEIINAIVAITVFVVIFRWFTSGKTSSTNTSATNSLGFRPRNVTQDMVVQIHGMFPDIPQDNIRYDLLRTGNVEITSNKILEKGYLDAPPPVYYRLYPRTEPPAPASGPRQPAGNSVSPSSKDNLITKFKLEDRLNSSPVPEELIGGKAAWEDTPEKREASLRERKAQMILAARQRLLAKQQEEKEKTGTPSQS